MNPMHDPKEVAHGRFHMGHVRTVKVDPHDELPIHQLAMKRVLQCDPHMVDAARAVQLDPRLLPLRTNPPRNTHAIRHGRRRQIQIERHRMIVTRNGCQNRNHTNNPADHLSVSSRKSTIEIPLDRF